MLPLIVSAVGLSEDLHNEIAGHLVDKAFKYSNTGTYYSAKKEQMSTYYLTSDSEQETAFLHDSMDAVVPPSVREDDTPFGSETDTKELPLTTSDASLLPSALKKDETIQSRVLKMASDFPDLFQWNQVCYDARREFFAYSHLFCL